MYQYHYYNSKRALQWLCFQACILCGFGLLSLPALADWQLDPKQSSLQFISSKLVQKSFGVVFEVNQFDKFSGSIDQKQAWLTIETASVNTRVPMRDERIRKHVLQSIRYPQARVQININAQAVEKIKLGSIHTQEINGTLTLANQTRPISARVDIVRIDANTLMVQTQAPILFDAKQYQMEEGFLKLKQFVNLFNIPTTIPINLRLVFKRS